MKRGKIIYEGNFVDWCVSNLLVTILCVVLAVPTLGISIIYLGYYQIKYFATRLSIIIED